VKLTELLTTPYGLPKFEPMESEDVYCYCFLKKEQQPMLEKYFKEKYASGMKRELVNEKSVTV
jgi:hypothetical protein